MTPSATWEVKRRLLSGKLGLHFLPLGMLLTMPASHFARLKSRHPGVTTGATHIYSEDSAFCIVRLYGGDGRYVALRGPFNWLRGFRLDKDVGHHTPFREREDCRSLRDAQRRLRFWIRMEEQHGRLEQAQGS